MIGLPAGYSQFQVGDTSALVRSDLEAVLRPLLAAQGTLLGDAAGARGQAPRLELPGAPPLRVRRYHRGGLVGRFLGDLHLSPDRATHELVALLRARRLGVPVPEPVAAVTARCAGGLLRHELATIEVPDARPLPEAIASCGARERRDWILRAARVVASLHAADIDHADLHAGNLLAAGGDVVLVDLDRCELGVTPRRRVGNLARLYRSVAKSKGLSKALSRTDRLRFLRAYGDIDVARVSRACERTVWWHSWAWGARG